MHRAFRPLTFLVLSTGALACTSTADQGAVQSITSALVTTVGVDADTYARSGSYANNNYGTAATLLTDNNDGSTVIQSYVRFAIGDVGTINSVKLRLRCVNSSSGTLEVRKVSNTTWGETTLTWNNKPAIDGPLVGTIVHPSSGTWVEVDVTSVSAPNTTVSLAIVNPSSNGADFSSRQASSNQPQVVIDAGSSGTGGTTGTGGAGTGGATGGSGGATGGSGGVISTDPNLKVAFLGDTADGSNYTAVLNLIQAEGAQAIVTAGDMTYDADPNGWWAATEAKVGQTFPVFLARGNHDDTSWSGFLTEAANHLGGATRVAGPHNAAYKTQFRGLDIVTIMKGDTDTTINNLFGSDAHAWKVCNWHQNQNKMQVGGKGDEMGWAVYEACRQKGAIIITGHEHSYERTKTMTNITNQTIDSTCSSGGSLCLGPGRSFVTVVGNGGTGLRSQVRCTPTASTAPFPSLNTSDPSCPIWASIYTTNQGSNYGALFITFNVDGNPKKAHAYYKDIGGNVIDPFDIFAD